MPWKTLISPDELARAIDHCVVVDCRHDLADPAAGRAAYRTAHIPGARFVDMDEELSAPKNGRNGRHPVPSQEAVRVLLESLGLSDAVQLVVYDDASGAMAGRLWWMARWIGHDAAAVLDGGYRAWVAAGYPTSADHPSPQPGRLTVRAAQALLVDAAETARAAASAQRIVLDARSAERYRGEVEPIDPVAGHIPGALNRPWPSNLRPDGRFKPAAVLRAEFDALLAGRPASGVVHQCGSGVSACHNVLAMVHAGLPATALYGGSWSEWVADPVRPVATGANP